MVNAQQYLDQKYPKHQRSQIKEINIGEEWKQGTLKLEGFTNLEVLDCMDNQLTKLDISSAKKLKKVFCDRNKLTELVIDSLPQLEILSCSENELSGLNIDGCPNLKTLECSKNKLTNLDLSNCSSWLERVWCSGNQLTDLDLRHFSQLKFLKCSRNKLTNLESLGLNQKSQLEYLEIDQNDFQGDLKPFSPLVNLKKLLIGYNDFSGSLEFLQNLNQLKELDISATNVDAGLEYIPSSLEKVKCYSMSEYAQNLRGWSSERGIGVKKIEEILKPYEKSYGPYGEESAIDFQTWRRDKQYLIERAKEIRTQLEKEFTEKIQHLAVNSTESQLQELTNIVLPNNQPYDFTTLKKEVQKLKSENLTNQIENKKAESEQLTSLVQQEKLHFKTRQELQNLIQTKQREINQLEQQLNNLQIQETQIQISPKK